MNRRKIWYKGENIVENYYRTNWYKLVAKNFTIRWWEIDLIFEKDDQIIFVEVKVVNKVEDLYWYITKKKINFLKRAVDAFLFKNKKYANYYKRLDVVFVKNWKIYQIFENLNLF